MLIVMPRCFSSGALSIWSNALAVLSVGYLSCSTLVMAAVSVVLPWSTCPIVPMFTCGLVRSNLALATDVLLRTVGRGVPPRSCSRPLRGSTGRGYPLCFGSLHAGPDEGPAQGFRRADYSALFFCTISSATFFGTSA